MGVLPETQNYLDRIEDLFGQIRALLAGLPAEALNWRPIESEVEPTSNSLAVLSTHVAGAAHFWIGEVVGGRPPTRDRTAEFAARADSPAGLVRLLEEIAGEAAEVLSALDAAGLEATRKARGRSVPVRWCILHVIDHTALHLGHMQITYQLWHGGAAGPSPYWHERLRATE